MEPTSPPTAPGRALPETGLLTFLFTDVEGSSPLWERHEAAMREATARHDALLDAIIVVHGGRRVRERGEGDSLFAVFERPDRAVAAGLAMARAVQAEPWPAETPIRIRMGLHTGGAQMRAGDYYGPVVNRCARIRGLGHGGQVLLSGATAALVRDALPAGASLRSLGAHTLRGHAEPEEVYQLCHPALPAEYPPLLSPQAPRHNLPAQLTGLIGREAEQGEVLATLAQARLVTLTGAGGVGKTRLALAVAGELVDAYPDGVWLVELAPLAEPGLVPGALAQALGVREEPGSPLTASLQDYMRDRRLLLVLDNCEHLVAACAELVSALLRHCPHLRILATSREGLAVAGEQQYRVPSLTVPDPKRLPPPEITGSYEAVRLFVARAKERRADFVLTAENARSVASICARLDGIPLAIELAAARVPALGVEGIAARLDDRFRLLTGGARGALPRQRTLRAALDWSHDLLSEREQLLLHRISVFAGGWTLGAAEAVCAGEGVEQWEVLDLLDGLVGKSLVAAEEREGGEVRYSLLETVRQYGLERLAATGGAGTVRKRHLGWCLALAEEASTRLIGAEQETWLARLEAEHDNVRTGLGWARECGDAEEGVRLAGALWRFWERRGYFGEGLGWLEAALAAGAQVSATARARALSGAGNLAMGQGMYGRAADLHAATLDLRRALGDTEGIAASLGNLGWVAERRGDYARATSLQEESLSLRRELGDTWGIANSLNNLGIVALRQGDILRASEHYGESLALMRRLGDKRGIASALIALGAISYRRADYARAAALYEEGLGLGRELGDPWVSAASLGNLAEVAHALGDLARAEAMYRQVLALLRDLNDTQGVASTLSNLGIVADALGDHERAASLFAESLALGRSIGAGDTAHEALEGLGWAVAGRGHFGDAARLGAAAEAARERLGASLPPAQRSGHERAMGAGRTALGEQAFAAAWEEGRLLPLDEAVALALRRYAEMSRGE